MPIKLSGNLSMLNDIVAEFGGTTPHKISEYYSEGTLPASGHIKFSDFYGQSASARTTINLTLSSNTNNYNIYSNRGGSYTAGTSDIILTINSGVNVGSTSTASYSLDTGSGWSSGDTIAIINNGAVRGRGGNGGAGGAANAPNSATAGGNGSTGGPAFRAQFAVSITNNGIFAGGGGGGGGCGGHISYIGKTNEYESRGGGGGGGGAGVNGGSGGAGGGATGATNPFLNFSGSAGAAGTATAGGSGGGMGQFNILHQGHGGAGGGPGTDGSSGINDTDAYHRKGAVGSGGTRGYYAQGNSNITWTTTGTRQGRVS